MQQASSNGFLTANGFGQASAGGSAIAANGHTSSLAGVLPANLSALSASGLRHVTVQPASSALQFASTPHGHGHAHLGSGTAYHSGNQLTAVPVQLVSVLQQQPTQPPLAGNNTATPSQPGTSNTENETTADSTVRPPAVEASFRVLELARMQVLQRPEHLPHFLVAHSHHHHDPMQPNGLCCGQRVFHHNMLPGTQTIDMCAHGQPIACPSSHTDGHHYDHHAGLCVHGAPLNGVVAHDVGTRNDLVESPAANQTAGNDASTCSDDEEEEEAVAESPRSGSPGCSIQPQNGVCRDAVETRSHQQPDGDGNVAVTSCAGNDGSDEEVDVTGGGFDDRMSTTSSEDSSSNDRLPLSAEQLQVVSQVWFTRTPDKEQLQLQGIKWKSGKWSAEENAILLSNIQRYLQENKMVSMKEVYEEKRKGFYKAIAMGIDRPLFSIYRRVGRLCTCVETRSGKYTQAEVAKLKELHSTYKCNWVKIGKLMGRSASSVKDRFRLIKKPCSNGRWTEEEEQLLSHAVHEVTDTPLGETVTKAITWSEVAVKVPSRSEKQCRVKWINYLSWKEQKGTAWTGQDELDLINKIEKLDAEDEADINWAELANGWASVRSPQWLHSRWWSMKRNVPKPVLVSHPNTVKYLKDAYPGLLERKANNRRRHSSAAVTSNEENGEELAEQDDSCSSGSRSEMVD